MSVARPSLQDGNFPDFFQFRGMNPPAKFACASGTGDPKPFLLLHGYALVVGFVSTFRRHGTHSRFLRPIRPEGTHDVSQAFQGPESLDAPALSHAS